MKVEVPIGSIPLIFAHQRSPTLTSRYSCIVLSFSYVYVAPSHQYLSSLVMLHPFWPSRQFVASKVMRAVSCVAKFTSLNFSFSLVFSTSIATHEKSRLCVNGSKAIVHISMTANHVLTIRDADRAARRLL
jgi:hypothetical protein